MWISTSKHCLAPICFNENRTPKIFFVTGSCPPSLRCGGKRGTMILFLQKKVSDDPPPQSRSGKGTIISVRKEWAGGSQIKKKKSRFSQISSFFPQFVLTDLFINITVLFDFLTSFEVRIISLNFSS